MLSEHRLEIFSCESSRAFAEKVVEEMNLLKGPDDPEIRLGDLEITHFSDGEFQPSFMESVRGASCYIIRRGKS